MLTAAFESESRLRLHTVLKPPQSSPRELLANLLLNLTKAQLEISGLGKPSMSLPPHQAQARRGGSPKR